MYGNLTLDEVNRIMNAPIDYPAAFVRGFANDRLGGVGMDLSTTNLQQVERNNLNMMVDSIDQEVTPKNPTSKKARKKIQVNYYQPVELAALGWINCDRFYNAEMVPEYTLQVEGEVPDVIGVYTIFKNINSVIAAQAITKGNNALIIPQNLPLNEPVKFIVYARINRQFVQSKIETTISRNTLLPVKWEVVPDDQVKKMFLN